ncbi:MAG: hypothetical protein MR986_01070, partial [Olsenella sp.]|nr:hypothetical protein [Olsenella sp.]
MKQNSISIVKLPAHATQNQHNPMRERLARPRPALVNRIESFMQKGALAAFSCARRQKVAGQALIQLIILNANIIIS